MRAVDVGFFEHLCEELIDEVARSGEPIAISRNGAPIAELAPVSTGRRGPLAGCGNMDRLGGPAPLAVP